MSTHDKNLTNSEPVTVGISNEKKNQLKLLLLMVLLCIPLLLIIGCGPGDCLKCESFGDNSNRVFVCATQTVDDTKYTSCVGPAGILGFGCNNSCWPTECVKIKQVSDAGSVKTENNGCVTFYHGFGCIDGATEKSKGKYTNKVTCVGIACSGQTYVEENLGGVSKATNRVSCFGCNCGDATPTESKDKNLSVPRQFSKGCWISGDD